MDDETKETLFRLGWTCYTGRDGLGNEYVGWQRGAQYFHVYHEGLTTRDVMRPKQREVKLKKYAKV